MDDRLEHWLELIARKLDRLIEIGESLEVQVRLPSEDEPKTVADVLRNDTCISSDAVADEPPKKWRIREPGEEVQEGDLMNTKSNPPSEPPDGDGWIDASICVGSEVAASDECVFACPVADEPAKEPVDHLAAPRILPGEWLDIRDAYRDVTPADVGRLVYVRNGELEPWIELRLAEVTGADFPYRCTKDGLDPTMWQAFRYATIRKERPAISIACVGEGYRRATRADLDKQCEFSDGSTNPDGSLAWGIFSMLRGINFRDGEAVRYYSEAGSYYDCRIKKES